MSKRQRGLLSTKQVIAVTLGVLGFFSLLGELGITSLGRSIYSLLKYILGQAAWTGPFLLLILAFVLWILSFEDSPRIMKNEKMRSRRNIQHKKEYRTKKSKTLSTKKSVHTEVDDLTSIIGFNSGIDLPKPKLVNLKGFNEYFSSTEGPEIKNPVSREEFEDLGRDFSTYFKEGSEVSFPSLGTRLEPVRGFSSYFDEVSAEIEEEIKKYARPDVGTLFPQKREWENPFNKDQNETKPYPGQVAQLVKLDRRSYVGVSPAEKAELLGIPTPLDINTNLDEVSNICAVNNDYENNPVERQNPLGELQDRTQLEESIIENNSDKVSIGNPENNKGVVDWGTELAQAIEVELSKSNNILEETDKVHDIPVAEVIQAPDSTLASKQPGMPQPLEGAKSQVVSTPKRIPWQLPQVEMLDTLPQVSLVVESETQKQLERVLGDFGIQAKVIRVARGPVITRYELAPAPGVKISRIVNLADDIALGLAARDVRIEAPIPGKAAIGIEVPNKQPRSVPFREVLETSEFKEGLSKLQIALGKDIANQSVVADLVKMPHLLVAGATGSGKSVCITALINSLLFKARPDEVKFLMIDPKMVELSIYNGIPHLLAPVVTDPKKAAAALKWVVKEMETRYELFAASGVRDIERYNRLKSQEGGFTAEPGEENLSLPWIVVIIDELADLMMVAADEVEEAICRLAQMARAAGIHLVIATQRPSVDVITGVIKANIPSRISFAVSSQIDSRTILDSTGAEKLLGRGDMLYSPQGLNKPLRVQGCMVTDDEVQRVISYWKAQGRPEYLDPERFDVAGSSGRSESSGLDDELFTEAGHLIITTGMASVSFLQRKLKLGYARAARLMDLLEENGVVGGYEGSKPRQILLSIEEFEERFG